MSEIIFEFKINNTDIIATGNDLTGKERIYVSGELVSEKRTFKKISSHEIEVNGENLIIKFDVESYLKGNFYCSIIRKNVTIRKFKAYYADKFTFEIFNRPIAIVVIIGLIFGLIDPSLWKTIIFLVVLFSIASAIDYKHEIIIKELDI